MKSLFWLDCVLIDVFKDVSIEFFYLDYTKSLLKKQ